MAKLTLEQLRQILRLHTPWEAEGWQHPDRVLEIDLKKGVADESIFNERLVNMMLSYEGRDVTAVLDFDAQGYLVGIEFV